MKAEQQYIELFEQCEAMICKHSAEVLNAPRAKAFADFKQQGFPYDWGCKNGYNDCSGLAQSVYRCMGIQLPRNTSSMRRIQRNMHSEGGINFDYTQFMPGSILLSSGHTMILVGTIDKNPIIIHAFGSYKQPPTWEKRQVSATCITSMSDLYWTDGERSIESIGHVYEIK